MNSDMRGVTVIAQVDDVRTAIGIAIGSALFPGHVRIGRDPCQWIVYRMALSPLEGIYPPPHDWALGYHGEAERFDGMIPIVYADVGVPNPFQRGVS